VVPSQLVELAQQALTDVRISVANGEPLVRCQLLASEFHEALKRALRAPELSPVRALRGHCGGQPMPSCRKCKHQPGRDGARAQSRYCNAAVQWATPPRRNARAPVEVTVIDVCV
jgi:hypothetical protein